MVLRLRKMQGQRACGVSFHLPPVMQMFRYFETLIDPFPSREPGTPPRRLLSFILHYSRPVLPFLGVMSVLTAMISVIEVVIIGYMGSLVDWLSNADRQGFLAEHGMGLAGMALLVVVGFPLVILAQSLLVHQTIFANYPMITRWLAHRYLLGQSLSFFQNEFAGRVSQKVMQTALAIRQTVMRLMDVLVYVVVYFTGALVMMGGADPWLLVPLLAWLAAYLYILVHFVPKLRAISMAQSDARAMMTGRVVDSYTNIQTIKLDRKSVV